MKKRIWLVISFSLLVMSCKSNYSNKYADAHIVLNQPEKYEEYEDCLSLITVGGDLNAIVGDDRFTPLTMAVFYGYIDIVEELISKGADIDSYDGIGSTPLITAIKTCDLDMVELLVKNGADVNRRMNESDAFFIDTSYGEYGEEAPIHIASRNGIKPIVELLIKNGVDVNSQYNDYGSAIKNAWFIAKDKEIVKMLIDAGAKATIHDYTFIGDIEEIKKHLNRDRNLINQKDVVGYTALHIAALEGHKEIAKLLIEKGADLNIQDVSGVTPLIYAVMNLHNEVAELLIDNNAALDIESNHGRTALFYAVEENNKEMQESLIDKGAKINIDVAVTMGDIERTKELIRNGIDLNTPISGYQTLLTLAVHFGQIEIAQLLIDNGIDVNKGFLEHQYPIVQAIETNNDDMLKMLLKNGAAINIKATTALHIASRIGLENIAKILIDNGANVNEKDSSGKTPLREACYYGDKETIRLFLEHGADISYEESIYRILKEPVDNGNTEVVELLLENGAKELLEYKDTKYGLVEMAIKNGYTDIVELLDGDAEQISRSKKQGTYSIIVTSSESVKKFLEFREISYDGILIPGTKLIEEIDSSISYTIPDNNYVGKKAFYADAIPNHKIVRKYCKEYSGFISNGKKYIVCNMIEGLYKPLDNKFHRLDSYDTDIKCIIIDAKTMKIEQLIEEPRFLIYSY